MPCKPFILNKQESPLEMYKTVPVWKREPVRVLSLFGDIKKGEHSEVQRTHTEKMGLPGARPPGHLGGQNAPGVPPAEHLGSSLCQGCGPVSRWPEGHFQEAGSGVVPGAPSERMPWKKNKKQASRCKVPGMRAPNQATACPWPPNSKVHFRHLTLDHPVAQMPGSVRLATGYVPVFLGALPPGDPALLPHLLVPLEILWILAAPADMRRTHGNVP